MPNDISGLWKANKPIPSDRELSYAIIQWTDAWLLTVLKAAYFQTYIDCEGYLHDQLDEFLTNRKHYDSLIKRREEFQEIDSGVSQAISERTGELEEAIIELKQQSEKMGDESTVFDIGGYLGGITEIIDTVKNGTDRSFVERRGFILGTIKKKLFMAEGEPSFSDILDQMMENLELEQGEMFYAEKNLKSGTSKDLYFYPKTQEISNPVSLDKISDISKNLNDNLLYSPFFFLYLNNKSSKRVNFHELREKIGIEIGNIVVELILRKINGLKMTRSG